MKNILLLPVVLILFGFILSCNSEKRKPDPMQLIQADRDFSLNSVKFGMKKAFLQFSDTGVVVLRPGRYPVEGKNRLRHIQQNIADSLFTLKWEPISASISASDDLGFTYGTYELTPVDTLNGNKPEKGSYVTIWKKQPDGSWKFTFDAGNKGLDR